MTAANLLKLLGKRPFTRPVETGTVSSLGPLAQQMQLEVAQTRMLKKQIDAEGQAALQLIQAAAPANTSGDVGRLLNVVA